MKKLIFVFLLTCLACHTSKGQVNTVWAKSMGGSDFDLGQLVEADGNGNVYTLGIFQNTVDFDPSANVFNLVAQGTNNTFLQKLDANGNFVWAKHIGISLGVLMSAMSVNNAGDIYIVGTSASSVDIDPDPIATVLVTGFFVLKLNTSGNFVWVRTLPSNIVINSYHVDVDSFGNIYVAGSFFNTADFDPSPAEFSLTAVWQEDVFILKLDSNGNFIWAKAFGGMNEDWVGGLKIDAMNHIYLVGRFLGTVDFDPSADEFLVSTGTCYVEKLTVDGNFVWVRTFGSNAQGAANDVSARDITVDSNNNPFIVGQYSGTQDFDPGTGIANLTSSPTQVGLFISKLASNGSFMWVRGTNSLSVGSIFPRKIYMDNTNAIYLAGSFNLSTDFDYGAGTYMLTAGAIPDGFIQKLDANGNFMWVKSIGEVSTSEIISGLFVDSNQFVYFTGNFSQTVNFDVNNCASINLTSVGQSDAFVAKLAPTNTTPVISFEPASTVLAPFTTTCIASTSQSFQVKGNELWGNLVVNAPVNYQISLTAGGTYTNSLTLTPTCGTVLPTTIFIRLIGGLTVGTYNNFVTLSSVGTASQTLPTAGSVQASSAVATIALAGSYCISAPAVPLSATPTGGTFTIDNIPATQFNPTALGVGSKVVKYNFTDANGCSASTTLNVMVNALPALSNNVNLSYGATQTGFSIIGIPAGSTYTMNGTPITNFIPSTWGAGTHTLVQSFTDANGCSNTFSKTINITEPPMLSNSTGATCWSGLNVSVDANMTVAGATPMTGAIVSFGAGYLSAQDRLIYPTPLFGVTGTFDVNTGVLRLLGNATTAQYQQVFRSIQYQNISANPSYGTTRTINFTAGDVLPLYPCGSTDAHFYKFVSAPQITWQNAKIAAENQNYFGLKGYLATISCVSEYFFAFNSIGQQGWIGASDDVAFTGSYSPNGEGQWYWATGPEAGTRFWQGNLGGTPVGGLYNNWAAGEPNNFQNLNESFAHLLPNGQWNDYVFNNSSIVGYYIEFGGLSTDPSIQNTTSSKQIQLATKLDFAIAPQFCANVPNIPLVGVPTGGTFKVNGNIATQFNPSALGVGTYTITYELAGCTIPVSKIVTVNPLPTPEIVGLQTNYCADVPSFALVGTPAGGTFTVNGGIATQFNPTALGAGIYTVIYSSTNGTGCTKTTAQNVTITALPAPEIVGLSGTYCVGQASLGLVGNPTGGTFQINNQNTNTLDIQALGTGKHTVSYTVINAQNCSKTATQEIEIFPLPTLTFVNVPDTYCLQASSFALEASPAGGTFKLNGVPSTTLNPADFAVGDQINVQYDYISPQGCANTLSKTLQIIFSSSFVQADFEREICPTKYEVLEAISLAEEQALTATNGQLQYAWSNGAKTRTISLQDINLTTGNDYKVLIRSVSGCPLRDFSFKVKVKCDTKLFLPDAFTPNGDGKNDLWEIFGGDFIKLDLRVYNRWGELIFVSNSQTQLWDGNVGGKPAPAGVYVWTVSYANPLTPERKERQQGKVLILR